MTQPSPSDDPELRALLDSIGMRSQADLSDDIAHRARAEAELKRILDHSSGVGAGSPSSRRTSRRRIAVIGIALAAACAVIAIPLGIISGSTDPAITPTVLSFAAPAQNSASDPGAHGAPIFTVIDILGARANRQAPKDPTAPIQSVEAYTWTASGELIARTTYTSGDRAVVDEVELTLTNAGGLPTGAALGHPRTRTQSALNASASPARLPHDRLALTQRLTSGSACQAKAAACALSELTRLYSTYVITPRVAADLWHAVARIPGITDLGTTHDRLGRVALGLSTATGIPGERLIVLADPTTGAFLGAETVRGLGTSQQVVAFTVIRSASRIGAIPHL